MSATSKRIVAAWITVCMLVSSFCVVMAEDSKYPDAKLVFSGFTLQYGQNGKIQGLVDVTLENINATGVSFEMSYDSKYLVPSNYDTNEPTTTYPEMLKQNTDVFEIKTNEYGDEVNYLNSTLSEIDEKKGTISNVLSPGQDAPLSDYIGEDEYTVNTATKKKTILAADRSVKLVTLSFEIINPSAFVNLESSDLQNVLSLAADDVYIVYIDDDEIEHEVSTIDYTWDVSRNLLEVNPTKSSSTVSAYTIYNEGTSNDLISYLNQEMNKVILKYSDGQQYINNIVWDDTAVIEPDSDSYNPKGGTYVVSQVYMDKIVTVTVKVTPVTITGFDYDNRIKTYTASNRPQEWADLDMPTTVTPILYGVDDTYFAPTANPIQTDWEPDYVTDALKSGDVPVSQTYEYEVALKDKMSNLDWLTIPDSFDWTIDAIRNVVSDDTGDFTPDTITASVERETGILTINVGSLGGGNSIEEGTEFNIYLPNGKMISTVDDFVTLTINNGKATIEVNVLDENSSTTLTNEEREQIQALINTAEPGFELTAVKDIEGVKIESDKVPFSFDARVNYYLDDDVKDGYIEKDYSDGRQTMFVVYPGQSLDDISTYVVFPDDDTIPIAYDGQTGLQPATLGVAKVDEWVIEGSTEKVIPNSTEPITLVGMLSDYTYTNFGYVTNPDKIQLKIKVSSSSVSPPDFDVDEEIKISTDITYADNSTVTVDVDNKTFEYDKKTVGYHDIQEQVFTIENIGQIPIDGLSVRITDIASDTSNGTSAEYVLNDALTASVLDTEDTTQFTVRTKGGLPAGTYTARVIVGSAREDELSGFNISFVVTEKEVYTVTVDSSETEPKGIGYGYLSDENGLIIRSRTYIEGEEVDLYAVVMDSAYIFNEWTADTDKIILVNSKKAQTSFTMIAGNVTVTPTFMETPAIWIRLASLEDYNEGAQEANELRDIEPPYNTVIFSESQINYRVVVDGDVEKNYIKFALKEKHPDGVTVDVMVNDNPCATSQDENEVFTSDLFDLLEGENIVKVHTQYIDGSDTFYEQTYTLQILRRKAVNVKKMLGNSPYGLIEADDNVDNDTAEAYFHENHTYGKYYVPKGAAVTYQTMYYPDAWTTSNYDEDPYALFVYSDTTFVDPGFTDLKDSDDEDVDATTVKRTIELEVLTEDTGSSTDLAGDLQKVKTETVEIPNGGETCVIDLTSYNVRPGAYSIKYTYKDVDGMERTFSRPLIVLAKKGDVNLDKSITSTDYDTIYQRIKNGLYKQILQSDDDWAKIYTYRVCDVTEDRNVNSIDANAVKNTTLTQYYELLPTTLDEETPTYDAYTAQWKEIGTVPTEKPTLQLDYLGAGGGTPDRVAVTPNIKEENIGTQIWVGVGIDKPTYLKYFAQGIYSMELAIDYDPEIFQPCDSEGNSGNDLSLLQYADTINEVNMAQAEIDANYLYWENASLYTKSLQLDAADLNAEDSKYKTEFVTILSNDGTNLRMSNITNDENTVYLLRVPFKLIKYPDENYTGNAVTIHLTEQTFVLGSGTNGDTPSAGWEGAIDKTTEVNNLKNHFAGVSIVDLFDTNGKFNIVGQINAWNKNQPIEVDVYKSDSDQETDQPEYTFTSADVDELGAPLYGELEQTTAKGEVEWKFTLPVSNRFDYKVVIKKQSHLTYSDISVSSSEVKDDTFTIADPITLIVGDINGDQVIKLPDRWELMRFFNRQKPWQLDKNRFEAADLNGDDLVTLVDLDLLNRNYEKAYAYASDSTDNGEVNEGGDSS
jgi:hypothetical protein